MSSLTPSEENYVKEKYYFRVYKLAFLTGIEYYFQAWLIAFAISCSRYLVLRDFPDKILPRQHWQFGDVSEWIHAAGDAVYHRL